MQFLVRPDQRGRLALDLVGHAVEGAIEEPDLVGARAPLDPQRVITGTDAPGGANEFVKRLHLPVGIAKRKPDREHHEE